MKDYLLPMDGSIYNWMLFGALLGAILSGSRSLGAEIMTKERAYGLMKENGFRWKQTDSLLLEAEGKGNQAHSLLRPHLAIVSREYVTRLNQIEFGFAVPGDLSIVSIGATMLEIKYAIFDQTSLDRVRAADVNQHMAAASRAQYQSDLTYLMLAQYLNAQRMRKRMDVIDANIKRNTEILKFAEAKVSSGLGIYLDVMRAKGLLEATNLKKLDATIAYSKARQELAVTLGRPQLDEELELLVFREVPNSKLSVESQTVLDRRPDIASAKLAVDVTHLLREAAEDEVYPKFGLLGQVGIVGNHVLGGQYGAFSGSVGLQITFPLTSSGLIQGRVQEESSRVMKAEYQVKELELESKSQLSQSREQLQVAKSAVEISTRQVEIAEEELKLAKKRFHSGTSNGLELANSQVNLATALDLSVEATFAYELSKVTFYKSIAEFDEYFASERTH